MRREDMIPSLALFKSLPVVASDGTSLAVRVYPNSEATHRLVVSHGNGLAAMGYRAFWEPLQEHFEVIVFDMRGHGGSEAGELSMHCWAQFVVDLDSLLSVLSAVDPRPLIGAFHSLSAVTSLIHLGRRGNAAPWKALALFDPPITGPADHPLTRRHAREMQQLAMVTARRRSVYASVDDRAAQFSRADVFGAWQPKAITDMAKATLRADGNGAWQLSCEPRREAFIYSTAPRSETWAALTSPPCPLILIAGDASRPQAESPQEVCLLAHEQLGVPYASVAGTGHFLQLEQPERCRQELLGFVAAMHQ